MKGRGPAGSHHETVRETHRGGALGSVPVPSFRPAFRFRRRTESPIAMSSATDPSKALFSRRPPLVRPQRRLRSPHGQNSSHRVRNTATCGRKFHRPRRTPQDREGPDMASRVVLCACPAVRALDEHGCGHRWSGSERGVEFVNQTGYRAGRQHAAVCTGQFLSAGASAVRARAVVSRPSSAVAARAISARIVSIRWSRGGSEILDSASAA